MQNMPNQNLPPNNVVRRVQSYLKENNELLRKHKLIARLVIHFGEKKSAVIKSYCLVDSRKTRRQIRYTVWRCQ